MSLGSKSLGPKLAAAIETRRIEAGLPLYGTDVTDENFPFEGPLERLIDYKKGCYIGQEPVARVSARGAASQKLVGLTFAGAPPAVGTPIAAGDKSKGKITSATLSPVLGAIALGYVPRDFWAPGTTVTVGDQTGTVATLPFASQAE